MLRLEDRQRQVACCSRQWRPRLETRGRLQWTVSNEERADGAILTKGAKPHNGL
jgi:hypothetical protein